MPEPFTAPPVPQGQQQAILGAHGEPDHTEKQPLRIFVHESQDGEKMRFSVNESNTHLSPLPNANERPEASSHAADNEDDKQLKLLDLWYTVDTSDAPDQPSNEMSDQVLKYINTQPTTVMITAAHREEDGPPGFKSATHLANVVDRVFGSSVKHLILNSWFETRSTIEDIYWPHTVQTWDSEMNYTAPTFTTDHPFAHLFVTPDLTLHLNPIFYRENQTAIENIYYHLLKFHELLAAAPHLQSIELQLHTYCWEDVLLLRVKATNKEGVLWVDWEDVKVPGFLHTFVSGGRRRERRRGGG